MKRGNIINIIIFTKKLDLKIYSFAWAFRRFGILALLHTNIPLVLIIAFFIPNILFLSYLLSSPVLYWKIEAPM